MHMTLSSFSRPRLAAWVLAAALALAAASWGITYWQGAASQAAQPGLDFFAISAPRTGLPAARLVESLQQRIQAQPDDTAAYAQLGQALLELSRQTGDPRYYQKAEQALKQTLQANPNDYAALTAMGTLALARHQFAEGLEWGLRAVAVDAQRSQAYGVVVDGYVELGQYEEAITALQTMVDLRPNISAFTRIAYLRELHGDLPGALEAMQMAVDGSVAGSEAAAWTRTQLGNLYFNTGMLAEAAVQYEQVLAEQPGYVYALAGLGRARLAAGRSDEALELLGRASAAMPIPEFIIYLGEAYQALGRSAEAHEQYRLLGAIQQLYQAEGVDLDLELALFNADHLTELKLAPEAVVTAARAGYNQRPSVYAADVLAWALYRAGQFGEASEYSQKALSLGGRDALKVYHAGMIALASGDPATAAQLLRQALEINPHFSPLHAPAARQTLLDLDQ